VVTVGSDGAVTIRAVAPGSLRPDLWESKSSWYDPRSNRPTFLVTDSESGFFNHWQPNPAALAAFGRPAAPITSAPTPSSSGTRTAGSGRAPVTARLRGALLARIALAVIVLLILYLRQSRSVTVGSDGARRA